MLSIDQLERLLEPYMMGGGFADEFATFSEYSYNGITVRTKGFGFEEGDDLEEYRKKLEGVIRGLDFFSL